MPVLASQTLLPKLPKLSGNVLLSVWTTRWCVHHVGWNTAAGRMNHQLLCTEWSVLNARHWIQSMMVILSRSSIRSWMLPWHLSFKGIPMSNTCLTAFSNNSRSKPVNQIHWRLEAEPQNSHQIQTVLRQQTPCDVRSSPTQGRVLGILHSKEVPLPPGPGVHRVG